MKALLVGGYPKGYLAPFSVMTISGRRIRKMVAEVGLDAKYLDLWEDEAGERKGELQYEAVYAIEQANLFDHRLVVALGKKVQQTIAPMKCYIGILDLPHPAARRTSDLNALRDGLLTVAQSKSTAQKSPERSEP